MKSKSSHKQYNVAFVGNPNAGKTTLFNSITGSRQKVGNYAGVTVEKVYADVILGQLDVRISDVPGLYSLEPVSADESVAVSVIQSEVDLIVCIIDASNLERNLYLFSQISQLKVPMVVAVTMVDRLAGKGNELDIVALSEELGCPVVAVVGHKEEGIANLRQEIETGLLSLVVPSCEIHSVGIENLRMRLARIGYDVSPEGLSLELQKSEPGFVKYFSEFPELKEDYLKAQESLTGLTVADRFAWAKRVQDRCLSVSGQRKGLSITDKVDRILTHRFFGLIVFTAVMYTVFLSIYSLSQPFMSLIETLFAWMGSKAGLLLSRNELIQSFVVDGIIAGVGGVVVFLPQILILFFFAFLEGTGYLSRAAFLMDRLLGWCGLNGRAFIPLLSSFACAIPGIMAARVMPDAKSRLATILVAPLMSCSARLPVYMLLIGAFIEPKFGAFWAGTALFGMHLLGLMVAIPVVFILNRGILKGKRLPFVLELPPYQLPKWKDVLIALTTRAKVFLTTAGTTILVMSILIWAAGYFPRLPESQKANMEPKLVQQAQLEHSALGRFGKIIEPVFMPLGFDWRISTAIICAFPARETVVPSMGILFSLGSGAKVNELREQLQKAKLPNEKPLFTPWTAVGMMVFFALCAQCFSTLATVRRETGSRKWAYFMFVYMTALAYIGAFVVQLLGKALGN
ncbi:MAG: ferrous iron transport protein B [Fimbriimonadales bacterium]|nr:ferrous iron transport protein B [Fimbriimonadales bacterium]